MDETGYPDCMDCMDGIGCVDCICYPDGIGCMDGTGCMDGMDGTGCIGCMDGIGCIGCNWSWLLSCANGSSSGIMPAPEITCPSMSMPWLLKLEEEQK